MIDEFNFSMVMNKDYALVGIMVFLGQFVYAAVGFGSGMVTVSLLALCYDNLKQFIPLYLLLCLPTEIAIAYKDRDKIEMRRTAIFLLFILPTLVIGTYLLKVLPDKPIEIALGAVITLLAIYYLLYEQRSFPLRGKYWVPLTATLSGLLGSLYGIGGPPLIFYFKSLKLNKQSFRVALLSIFLMMGLLRLITYIAFQLYTLEILIYCLLLLPFTMIGLASGMKAYEYIPEKQFKQITSIVLLVNGLLLVIINL